MRPLILALALVLLAAFTGVMFERHSVRVSCDRYGAVKIGHDVYECRRERGVS